MTRLEILAIRALPEEYIADGTQTATFNGGIVVLNPEHPPMLFWNEADGWKKITFSKPDKHGTTWSEL